MDAYTVKPIARGGATITVSVPSSKSILNRAIVLAAFTDGDCLLRASDFGTDTEDLLGCLTALGIGWERTPEGLLIHGSAHPRPQAVLHVGSAGTAARFLPAVLAARGGDYTFFASEQMQRRPMELASLLATQGAEIEFLGEKGHFPFRLRSNGIDLSRVRVDTAVSTQYASGLLLAAAAAGRPISLDLAGPRTSSGYIRMTRSAAEAFGCATRGETCITLTPQASPKPREYCIEPDLSGACYFYALSLLLSRRVVVRGVHLPTLQGDAAFFDLLASRGVLMEDTTDGLAADGTAVDAFDGFETDMRDFSDQTLTVAALAPFAKTPTRLWGIAHIRRQECDRIAAISENLTALGVPCRASEDKVRIDPAPVRGGLVRTFSDHRVAMAFSLIGLRAGGITIDDPSCTRKTFGTFFRILESLS